MEFWKSSFHLHRKKVWGRNLPRDFTKSQLWKQIQILQSKQNPPVFYFLCQNYCCQWHSSNSFLPERYNKIFKLAHAGPKLPNDDRAGEPFVPVEIPDPDLLWCEASYRNKIRSRKSLGGEKILTSGLDLSLSTGWAPRCSSRATLTDRSTHKYQGISWEMAAKSIQLFFPCQMAGAGL